MPKNISLCEWSIVKKGELGSSAWKFFTQKAQSTDENDRYFRFRSPTELQVTNYVGVITAPDGTQIEILPKVGDTANIERGREILWKILCTIEKLRHHLETTEADLRLRRQPLIECLIDRFLQEVKRIIATGVRRDYHRTLARQYTLKGQLQVMRQINEPPHRQNRFHVKYDVFSPNRAENRLIHTALDIVGRYSRSEQHRRLIRRFYSEFQEAPVLMPNQYKSNFSQWSKTRDMIHYQGVLPWLRLILNLRCPWTVKGNYSGISFLFRMEQLFEKYVFHTIRKALFSKGYDVVRHCPRRYLAFRNGKGYFRMEPDIGVLKDGKLICLLDTKWKIIDQKGISQADVYQIYAYARRNQVNDVALIYPHWTGFTDKFECTLGDEGEAPTLSVFPFDLDKDDVVDANRALFDYVADTNSPEQA